MAGLLLSSSAAGFARSLAVTADLPVEGATGSAWRVRGEAHVYGLSPQQRKQATHLLLHSVQLSASLFLLRTFFLSSPPGVPSSASPSESPPCSRFFAPFPVAAADTLTVMSCAVT